MTEKHVVNIWENWSKKRKAYPVYDNWLDKYKDLFETYKEEEFLDLGCGLGADTAYLIERGYQVLSCDIAYEALKNIEDNILNSKTLRMDMTLPFPIESNSYSVIIADLSLHYFNERDTIHIMEEIKRLLKPGGVLLARVARVDDYHFGAGVGKELEKNFYFEGDYYKRFFDDEDIQKFFSIIGEVTSVKTSMTREEEEYQQEKQLFEVQVIKI